jgi:hypothetical protein
MKHKLTLTNTIPFPELTELLRKLEFRAVFDKNGDKRHPYENAKFSLAKVLPSKKMIDHPVILRNGEKKQLFSPQPTLYQNQLEIIKTVDQFLRGKGMRVNKLKFAIEYDWAGRDTYHMLPPIIEKHTYHLTDGFIDLDKLINCFDELYVKDSAEVLHRIADRYLKNFHIDEVSAIREMDVFHSNASLINYGLRHNGKHDFYIVCDGMHRIDYAIETLNEPIDVILVEGGKTNLVPYYAFPMPYHPTIRLSSKQSEKMYPRLERDKVHLFNDFLKKVLHYDWTEANLNVSRLRSNL